MDLKKIREDLHRIPEIGFNLFKTQAYIEDLFKNEKILNCHKFDFTGLLYEYKVNNGYYQLFRADMDALTIKEETFCPFRSQHEGVMHACGHDIHMTILIGLIDRVLQEKPDQNLLFLFQPAEEGQGGAERIIKTGIFKRFQIKSAFTLHVNGILPLGTVASRPGIFFANAQEVNVLFKGISAHIAFPEQGRNALEAGVIFYQKFKERLRLEYPEADSVIVEFGKMQAGTVMNAIADDCKLEGTIRTFKEKDLDFLKKLIDVTALQAAEKLDLEYEIQYHCFYKNVKNDAGLVNILKEKLKNLELHYQESDKVFTGEDFGFFTHMYKGLLFWLGTNKGENEDLHSSRFLPSSDVIPVGVNIFWELLKKSWV